MIVKSFVYVLVNMHTLDVLIYVYAWIVMKIYCHILDNHIFKKLTYLFIVFVFLVQKLNLEMLSEEAIIVIFLKLER